MVRRGEWPAERLLARPFAGATRRSCGACRRERILAAVIAAERSLPAEMVTDALDVTMILPGGECVLADSLTANPWVLHVGHAGCWDACWWSSSTAAEEPQLRLAVAPCRRLLRHALAGHAPPHRLSHKPLT